MQAAPVESVHVADVDISEEWQRFLVNSSTCASWSGEAIVVFHRGIDFWACQQACPHASISLEASDIEDFRPGRCSSSRPGDISDVEGLDGPCIACPAHMVCTTRHARHLRFLIPPVIVPTSCTVCLRARFRSMLDES